VEMNIRFWMVVLSAAVLSAGGAAAESPASLAEPPHWPVGFNLPDSMTEGWRPRGRRDAGKADVLVWTPPSAKRVRAALLIPNNTDSKHFGEHGALREVAAKRELGIVYLRRFEGSVVERTDPPEAAEKTFAALMDLVAKQTGIVEYRHAPWITFGKSSRGRFPFRTAWWFPDRVIASISYHGETPTWPMADWSRARDETVLHVAVNGDTEWMGTWYRHVRPSLLNYRANTAWLPHMVVLHGVGHGNYADTHGSPGWGQPVPPATMSCLYVWDYLALYVDKAIESRVPDGVYPTNGPVRLKQLDPDSGWLIHPRAAEQLLGARWRPLRVEDGVYRIVDHIKEPHEVYEENPGRIDPADLVRPASEVPKAERRKMFWIADRELADAWIRLHSVHKQKAGRAEVGDSPGEENP
jgi:hypothetical protein